MSDNNNISNCQESFSEEYLLKYINDELSVEESLSLETHLRNCEVCSDQIDGLLMLEDPNEIIAVSAELNSIIDSKTKPNRKILGLEPSSFKAIAAVFLLLTISGTYVLIDNLISDNKLTTVNEISQIENTEETTSTEDIDMPVATDTRVADMKEAEKSGSVVSKSIAETTTTQSTNNEQVFFEIEEEEARDFTSVELDEVEEKVIVDEINYSADISIFESEVNGTVSNGAYDKSGLDDFDQDITLDGNKSMEDGEALNSELETVIIASEISKDRFWSNSRRESKKVNSSAPKLDRDVGVNENTTTLATGSGDMPSNPVVNNSIVGGSAVAAVVVTSDDEVAFTETQTMSEELSAVSHEELTVESVDAEEIVLVDNVIVVSDNVDLIMINDDFDSEDLVEPIAFHQVEEKPQFPGGDTAIQQYLADNYKYPEVALESQIQGKVYVQFVIKKNGKVEDVMILRGIDPYLDAEALRVVRSMPDWIPGKNNGVPVDVSFVLPVRAILY